MYTRLNDELRLSPNLFTDNRNWQTEYYCERGLQRTNLYQDGVIFFFFYFTIICRKEKLPFASVTNLPLLH